MAQALGSGASDAEAAAAAKKARRLVYPSAVDALLYPAIRCNESDTTTVMKIFYGAVARAGLPASNAASAASARVAGRRQLSSVRAITCDDGVQRLATW